MGNNNNNDDQINNNEDGRRELLKKLSAGGSTFAIAKWVAPVVTAVSVPAHAQMSPITSLQATAP